LRGRIFSAEKPEVHFFRVLGLALMLRSDWTILLLMPAALIVPLRRLSCAKSAILEQKFGDSLPALTGIAGGPRYGFTTAGFPGRPLETDLSIR